MLIKNHSARADHFAPVAGAKWTTHDRFAPAHLIHFSNGKQTV